MKSFILKLIGTEKILSFVADFVAKIINQAGSNFEADKRLHDLGKMIRERIPGDSVEREAGHLIRSFKSGLLGKEFDSGN